METLIQSNIQYYCREGFYQEMRNAATDGMKRYPGDPVYKFYYGVAMVLEGRVQEGIRELTNIQSSKDVMLGSILALIYAHRKCKVIDKDAVAQLDGKLKENRKHANDKMLFFAGLFLFFIGRPEKAKEYVDRMLKLIPSSREGLILKGWLEVSINSKDAGKNALQYFDAAGSSDPECLFGRALCYQKSNNLSKALDVVNQVVVLYPQLTPALLEKMKLQMAQQDWEQTLDSINRALGQNRQCVEAQRHLVLISLCRDGNYVEASNQASDLIKFMDSCEPKNAHLYYETAQVIARICGRKSIVLQHTYSMAEKASNLDPMNADYATELGYQCLLQGKIKDASKFYHSAIKRDEGSIPALMGVIFCQLLEGQLDIATQQLELLKEIQRTSGMSSELLFLCGLLAQKQNGRTDEVLGYLNECIDAHFSALEGYAIGLKYFLLLNPDFLLLNCKLYLQYVPDHSVATGQPVPPALKRCLTILNPISRACPGLLEASFLTARLKYFAGEIPAAQSVLERCLEQDETFADARLLLAQILLHQGNVQSANQTLEVALSYSFEVRDKLQFHLIRARIQKAEGQLEEAVKTLKTGMAIAGLKPSSASQKKSKDEVSMNDKVSLYLEMTDVHRKLNMQHEAAKLMEDALREFQGTPEEMRIVVANADLSLSRGDTEQALTMLRNIGPEQAYYLQAREKMADIYLNYRKDRRLFASCYREVVEKYPTAQSYIMLGDAYMSIQEPERAIEVYEQALKRNPRDSALARKIGQGLVKIHQYDKAVTYYKSAIKSSGQMELRYDLAELLFRMRKYRDVDDVIMSALQLEGQDNDLTRMQWESKFLLLQSQVHLKLDGNQMANQTLQKARDVQSRVMRRVPVEQPDSLAEQRKLAVSICTQLAERAGAKRDFGSAAQYYREALIYDDNNTKVMLALAKLEITANNLEAARQYCMTILKSEKDNDAATLMMADITFRKNDLEGSMIHFQQLLERKPDYYPALARYIETVRRVGKLEEVPKYLEKGGQNAHTTLDTGYFYCKGLYEWYTGNKNGAMKSFNLARNDSEWGLIATYHMIEICVNPENDTIGGETFESFDDSLYSDHESAVRTAEKLLSEIRPKAANDFDYRLMNNFLLLAKKQKNDADSALQDFLAIASNERYRDHVGVILGMATAYMIMKHVPKARNQLKRVSKAIWSFQDAEYLERCWLLLADIFIQAGKYDNSTELLRRIIQYNKSCTKAYEYMGFIMEKEQSYRDAANHYEMAWKQGSQTNPVIGYKLAFNYMKAKRYVDAIDVCHTVLGKYPSYPKIRKDILEKSRSSLRI